MIEITLNGLPLALEAPVDVAAFLATQGLTGKRVAVEINGAIVPKSQHATVVVAAGDHVEVVIAVGGG